MNLNWISPTARYLLVVLLVVASGCTPRAQLVSAEVPASMGHVRQIFVATTRAKALGIEFGEARSRVASYARFDISVPPRRKVGEITWPQKDADPETEFVLADMARFDAEAGFRRDLRRALLERPAASREAIIFVHGFNNTFAEGVLRITQLAEDFALPGIAVHFSWPSAGTPLGYAYDRDSALLSRDALQALIATVRAAGAERVILVGHSLGGFLVMESLRQMAIANPGSVVRQIGGVILISPDIDIDVFRSQADRIGTLPQPFGIFVSRRDRALFVSARLTGQSQRLGNVGSFEKVADLQITFVDVTDFSEGLGHFVVGNSPALIQLFTRAKTFDAAFRGNRVIGAGLAVGTVLTIRNATDIVLNRAGVQ